MQSFVRIKPLRNDEITLSFTEVGESYPSRDFLRWQICLLALFAEIKFLQNFPNIQYWLH